MIRSRKGVIGLPIKLAVSFMILALMVPPIMSAAGSIQQEIGEKGPISAAEELSERIEKVSMKSLGYRTHMELEIPGDSYLAIGGQEGHVIRVFVGGGQVSRVLLDTPVIGDELFLYGNCLLEIGNTPDGQGVMVKEI